MSSDDREQAIRARWATYHDRGAHDYTDAGCRVLAEHAFTDVPFLLAALAALELELTITRDKLEHAERKLAGEWPYDETAA